LLLANPQLDTMIAAIQAKRKLKNLPKGDRATIKNVEKVLNQAVYGTNDRLFVGIDCQVQQITTIDEENTIKYWNLDGNLIAELNTLRSSVGFVAMSANSLMEISANNQG
jgi:hypothetical protein